MSQQTQAPVWQATPLTQPPQPAWEPRFDPAPVQEAHTVFAPQRSLPANPAWADASAFDPQHAFKRAETDMPAAAHWAAQAPAAGSWQPVFDAPPPANPFAAHWTQPVEPVAASNTWSQPALHNPFAAASHGSLLDEANPAGILAPIEPQKPFYQVTLMD